MIDSAGPDSPPPDPPVKKRRHHLPPSMARFVAISWHDLAVSFGPILLVSAVAIYLAVRLIQPAPPSTLIMSAGPKGSSFYTNAEKYRDILARNGVTVKVLETQGSLDNLQKLEDPNSNVDVGFVQGGMSAPGVLTGRGTHEDLVSLGSVADVPLAIFYRGPALTRLSEFKGKRLAIGAEGSGTRALALALLKANDITPGGDTQLQPLSGDEAADALTRGDIDAAFLTGDSAQPPTMVKLFREPGIRFFDFTQAEAYARRFPYLKVIDLPMGSLDFAKNLPPHTIHLVAPTAELIARDGLHPALSDLLIEAAKEVHGRATLTQTANEFPAPLQHEFRISDDAERYYKSGKSFLYRSLPFWIASLADRVLVLLVPVIVVLVPGLRLVPGIYRWRVKSRIYKMYGALIAIEREALNDPEPEHRDALITRVDGIETAVNRLKMPLAYADQFYVLREHIGFVRHRLAMAQEAAHDAAHGDSAVHENQHEGDTTHLST